MHTTSNTKYQNSSGKPQPGTKIKITQLNTTTIIVIKPLEVMQPFKQMTINSLAHYIFIYDCST